ncbi:MAG: hypothetical protein ACYTHJ_09215 [Planctomycetota bacterium]|jgi:diamine N-acetyltransferase
MDRGGSHAELDVWMRSESCCGMEHGSAALAALCRALFIAHPELQLIIRPSLRNPRAIRACRKAGFIKSNL